MEGRPTQPPRSYVYMYLTLSVLLQGMENCQLGT